MICKICKKEIKLKGFAIHIIKHHNISCKEYYDTYLKSDTDGICKTCGKSTSFHSIKFGYRQHCCNRCAQLDPEIKEKKAQTCLSRFGATNVYASEYGKNKIKKTMQEKYSVDSILQLDNIRQKTYESMKSEETKTAIAKTKLENIHKFEIENDCTLFNTLRKQYGQGWIRLPLERIVLNGHASFIKNSDIPKIIEYIEKQGSSFEYEVRNYIKSIYTGKIITNTRSIISPLELDIYIPDKHVAIECNGIFWHSSLNKCNKQYHYNKSILCQENGIRLIHIYETEWFEQQDKIKQLLNNALDNMSKIYARQCDIKIITNKEAKLFNNNIHLQNHKDAQVTYGLFYKNKLVQLMSFSTNIKYNQNLKNNNEWEIIRECSIPNTIIVGGISKLFRHFIRDYKPLKIFSYCDFNKFNGKSYEIIGMSCIGYTEPNMLLLVDNSLISIHNKNYKNYKDIARGILWDAGYKKYEIIL